MKHVKAACILQTLVFAQKDDCGLTREQQLKVNHDEVSRYKATMDRSRTRYQITEETEQADGSVLVRVRKQYNDKADVSEYFNERQTRLMEVRRVCDRKRGYDVLTHDIELLDI